MRRDTEIGILAGIVLAIIVGVFISTRTVIKGPTLPLSGIGIYEEKIEESEAQDLGILAEQLLPKITEVPEKRPEAPVHVTKRQPPADEWVEVDEEKEEVVEGEWIEVPPPTPPPPVVRETKPKTKKTPAKVKEPVAVIHLEEDLVYKVKPNDTLSKLAKRYYGDQSKWGLIYDANIGKISHRNALYAGQKIVIPAIGGTSRKTIVEEIIVEEYPTSSPPPETQQAIAPEQFRERTHTVQKGDTLIKLARQYYNSEAQWKKIYSANKHSIPNPNNILLGTVLVIPK